MGREERHVVGCAVHTASPTLREARFTHDAHERWKWAVPKVSRSPGQPVEPQEQWRDYDRVRDHIRKAMN